MLESLNSANEMDYQKLSPEEQASRGILGRLAGPMADFKNSTRNGRKYKESLWEKVFDNPIIKEKIDNKCLFGELGHPEDRSEVDMEKIAICLAEVPKKGKDGKLHGVFDILDTPNGRILKTLCDYGCLIGVSSRGTGDVITDYDGSEVVDEDTYECECWDAVLLPAVKDARLKLVTESLDANHKSLKQALQESIESSSEKERLIMCETLDKLKIDYKNNSSSEIKEEEPVKVEEEVADNVGTDLVNELQEALKENNNLQSKVVTLQEKLSVSYTKEVKLNEEITKLRDTVKNLAKSARKNSALSAQLKSMTEQLSSLNSLVEEKDVIIESFHKRLQTTASNKKGLKESLSSKDKTIQSLESQVSQLSESVRTEKREHAIKVKSLQEELSALKTDSQVKSSQYAKKLARSNELVETYRNTANNAMSKYIQCKADMLGVTTNEIENKLSENYSFDEIDSVCEDLRSYKLNMSKLPFNVGSRKISGMALKEDTSTKRFTNPDDEVDKDLFDLLK